MARTKQRARKGKNNPTKKTPKKNKQNGAQSEANTPHVIESSAPTQSSAPTPSSAAAVNPSSRASVHSVQHGRVQKSGKIRPMRMSETAPHTFSPPADGKGGNKQSRKQAKKARRLLNQQGGGEGGGGPKKMSEMKNHTITLPVTGKVSRMNGCVELPLSEDQLQDLVPQAKDFMFSHGLVMRTPKDPGNPDMVDHAPFTLLPSPVPRHCFMHAQDIQQDINVLMHKVAHDHEFLKNCLKSAIKNDDFTSRLWDIYEQVSKAAIKQPFDLAVLRSDYMLDSGIPTADLIADNTKVNINQIRIKQIEINTIASSFGGLSTKMIAYHKFMLAQMNRPEQAQTQIPSNKAAWAIAMGMVKAWKLYKQQEAAILFVVQENERNIYDQRFLEYAIDDEHPGLHVIRMTIAELSESARLDPDRRLFINDMEIAVVYLRALYTPRDLNSHRDWSVRLLLERSLAIKCPSVNYQLAGTKKVQQELARPGVLERYIDNPESVQRIRDSFAGQFSLDMGEEGDATVAMAMASPEKYVLKPQREGGGNNIFGEDIKTTLEDIGTTEERTAYVLMERVHPVPIENYPILAGRDLEPEPVDMVSELGIFGVFLGSKDTTILNSDLGFILRTKPVGVDEGGVATGYASIDSPYIIDDPESQTADGEQPKMDVSPPRSPNSTRESLELL